MQRLQRPLRRILIVLIAALLLSAGLATAADAASSPRLKVVRVDGDYTVYGYHFASNANGSVKAFMGSKWGQKSVSTNRDGYFKIRFNLLDASGGGSASAQAWVGNTSASTNTTIPGPDSTKTPTPATTPTTTAPAVGATGPSASGWNLVASDDFNDGSLDESKWGIYEGDGSGGTAHRARSQVNEGGGSLNIVGENNLAGGVGMKFDQTYGRYEIRSRVDAGAGYGQALLLWPSNENWPEDGELDFTEIGDADRQTSGHFVHYGRNNDQVGTHTYADFTQWHTWTVDWEPSKITYYLDGKAFWTITDTKVIPKTKMFLALQLDTADGKYIPAANAQTPAQVKLQIDSVKVYSR